jgi:hypothetical protein
LTPNDEQVLELPQDLVQQPPLELVLEADLGLRLRALVSLALEVLVLRAQLSVHLDLLDLELPHPLGYSEVETRPPQRLVLEPLPVVLELNNNRMLLAKLQEQLDLVPQLQQVLELRGVTLSALVLTRLRELQRLAHLVKPPLKTTAELEIRPSNLLPIAMPVRQV